MMDTLRFEGLGVVLIVAAVVIVVFLLLREFWCWYWKINEVRDLLKQLIDILGDQNNGSDEGKPVAFKGLPLRKEKGKNDKTRGI